MFDALTTKLSGIFSRLGSRGILKEKDIEDGLREIRLALHIAIYLLVCV